MKLVTFARGNDVHIGALSPGECEIVDFTASDSGSAFGSMQAFIEAGSDAWDAGRALLARAPNVIVAAEVRLLAPLPQPVQMRDFIGFEKHIRQARAYRYLFGEGTQKLDPADVVIPPIWYDQPLYYKCNRFSVVGPDSEIRWPRYCKMLDYELEIGFVIGSGGRDIPVTSARHHMFGLTIFNDMSARDAQIPEMSMGLGPAKGKDFDTGNVLGPWLVTLDEIDDPYDLTMVARVNGEEWSRGNSGEVHHSFEAMLSHVSNEETVHPGEFFGVGTVGSGCGLESGRFLEPGDVVELEVTGLGLLRNIVGSRS